MHHAMQGTLGRLTIDLYLHQFWHTNSVAEPGPHMGGASRCGTVAI